jgi:hypothetical protein
MITEKDLKKASKRRRKEDDRLMASFEGKTILRYKIEEIYWGIINRLRW